MELVVKGKDEEARAPKRVAPPYNQRIELTARVTRTRDQQKRKSQVNSAEIAKEILARMNLGLAPREDLLLKLSGKFAQLDHYISDSDIREKDKVYREMQENCLRIFLGLVAEGEYEKAGGISFLSDCK